MRCGWQWNAIDRCWTWEDGPFQCVVEGEGGGWLHYAWPGCVVSGPFASHHDAIAAAEAVLAGQRQGGG